MVRYPEFLFDEGMYFLCRPRLIGLEVLQKLLALPSGQFRGTPAAVIGSEFADAAVVPPLCPRDLRLLRGYPSKQFRVFSRFDVSRQRRIRSGVVR